jgi:hypothetical protein
MLESPAFQDFKKLYCGVGIPMGIPLFTIPCTSTLQAVERNTVQCTPCTSEVNTGIPGTQLVQRRHFFHKLTVSVGHRHSGNRVSQVPMVTDYSGIAYVSMSNYVFTFSNNV